MKFKLKESFIKSSLFKILMYLSGIREENGCYIPTSPIRKRFLKAKFIFEKDKVAILELNLRNKMK